MKKIIAIVLTVCVVAAIAFFVVINLDDKPSDGSSNSTTQAEEMNKTGVLARGKINGNDYTNTFADFTFTKPDDWNYLSDEEIAQFVGYDSNKLDIDEIEKALSENPVIYDMIVTADAYYGNSIFVSYENTMLSALRKLNEDEYIDLLKERFGQAADMTYTITETKDVALGKTTFKRATISVTANGMNTTQYYYIKAFDQYVVGIMVNLTADYEIETIEAMFS